MAPYLDLATFKALTLANPADVDGLVRSRWSRNQSDALAASSTPETKFADVVSTSALLFAVVTAAAIVAHDASNYATITLAKRTAGGAPVTLATLDTHATDLPPGVPVAMVLSGPGVTAEDVLTVAITKNGAGVVVPTLTLDVRPSISFFDLAVAKLESYMNARFRKRYKVPFAPVPDVVLRWEVAILTKTFMGRRGFNPGSEQDKAMILDFAAQAEAEIKEAADSKDGLFDLPLNEGGSPDTSAIAAGFVLGYSETSPYVGFDLQANEGTFEDSQGRGS